MDTERLTNPRAGDLVFCPTDKGRDMSGIMCRIIRTLKNGFTFEVYNGAWEGRWDNEKKTVYVVATKDTHSALPFIRVKALTDKEAEDWYVPWTRLLKLRRDGR